MSDVAGAFDDIAEWLLGQEAGGAMDAGHLAVVGEHLCRKLEAVLRDIIGDGGYAAVLGRAQHLAESAYPFLAGLQHDNSDEGCLPGLASSLASQEPPEARRGLVRLFAQALQILSALITPQIVLEQLEGAWPALPQPLLSQVAMQEEK